MKKQDLMICASVPVATVLGLGLMNPDGAVGQTAVAILAALKPLVIALWGLLVALVVLALPLIRVLLVVSIAVSIGALVRANRRAVSKDYGAGAILCGVVSGLCAALLSWNLILPVLGAGALVAVMGYFEKTKEYAQGGDRREFRFHIPLMAVLILLFCFVDGILKDMVTVKQIRNDIEASHRMSPAEASALDRKLAELARNDVHVWTLNEGRIVAPVAQEENYLTLRVPGLQEELVCRKNGNDTIGITFHKDTTVMTDYYLRRLCAARASEY